MRLDTIARRLNWTAIAVLSFLVVAPVLLHVNITQQPIGYLTHLITYILMPSFPFAILLMHLTMRSESNKQPSHAVSISVIVACVVAFFLSLVILVKGGFRTENGMAVVPFMPMATVPVAALSCFLSWAVAAFIISRKNKDTEQTSRGDSSTRAAGLGSPQK